MVDRRRLAEVILNAGSWTLENVQNGTKVSPDSRPNGLPQGWNKVKPSADGRS